jgi:hypothetical protein
MAWKRGTLATSPNRARSNVFGEVPLERVVAGQCPVAAPSGLAFGTDNTADRHDYNRLASFILDLNLQV